MGDKSRRREYVPIVNFTRQVKVLAARSGVSDGKVKRACDLFSLYEHAFRDTLWSQIHMPVTNCRRIWPRSKAQCNLLANRFVTRELLRLAGADLRPTKSPMRKRYAHVWGEICRQLGWKNMLPEHD
jgi:hypothetical protein